MCGVVGLKLGARNPELHGKITFLTLVVQSMSGGIVGGIRINDSGCEGVHVASVSLYVRVVVRWSA